MGTTRATGAPHVEPSSDIRTETRTKILSAALEVFAERGFASTTTAEISRRAGVAEKTLFSHFKTKEALFEQTLTPATLELLIPGVKASLTELLDGEWDDLEDFLLALFRNRLSVIGQHPSKFKMIVQELLLRPELGQPFRATFECKMKPLFGRVFEHLRSIGQLGDVRPEVVQRLCTSALFGYAIQRFVLRPDVDWDDDREIRETVRALVRGLGGEKSAAAPARPRPRRRRAR